MLKNKKWKEGENIGRNPQSCQIDTERTKSVIQYDDSEHRQVNCMTEEPTKHKCETETLLEYRFDGLTFHSIMYDSEWEVLSIGTSTGKLLNYKITIGVETCFLEETP